MKKIFFGEPDLGKEEINAVVKVIRSKWIGFGEVSLEFERRLSEYLGARYVAALSSCSAALDLSLILNNIKPGDEVITTSMTFAATANAICRVGAVPVFADINPRTLNIDEALIEKAITKKTKGIIVVHFGGLPCNMAKINAIAKKHNLFVVEDAAHAIGAQLNGRKIGNSKNITCFSFYGNKNLTSIEGGLITAPRKAIIDRAKMLRLQGLSADAWKRYRDDRIILSEVVELGYKFNITDVQSAVGLEQLKKLERNLRRREKHAKTLDAILSRVHGVQVQEKFTSKSIRHALHLYVVILDLSAFTVGRDVIVSELRKEGVHAAIHYKPVHLHAFYRKTFGYKKGDLRITERVGNAIFTLPLSPQLSERDIRWIGGKTKEILLKYHRSHVHGYRFEKKNK